MSSVSIQGNASGTGIFTIASPNSNTNRTLTLPDSSGTLALAGSSLTGVTESATPFETALGTGAGVVNTGVNNTFIGYEAGNDNTSGQDNTVVGYQALDACTTGSYNAAIGSNSMGATTTGERNTAVGYNTLTTNTTGVRNVAVGMYALNASTTGSYNTALGYAVLENTTTGQYNTAVGTQALDSNTTGSYMTAVGYRALQANTTGTDSTALGTEALFSSTTGNNNVAVGYYTLQALTTGSGNIGIASVNSAGSAAPVFNVTTENNRLAMGHTGITNAYVQVAWTVTSDARDKTNIQSVPHGLSFVNQLNPVSFQFKMSREDETPNGNKRYGFLAQDILALEGDDPVIIDNEVPEKLKYQGESLVPVLVNAIKELNAKVETLEAQNAAFEARLDALENK